MIDEPVSGTAVCGGTGGDSLLLSWFLKTVKKCDLLSLSVLKVSSLCSRFSVLFRTINIYIYITPSEFQSDLANTRC